MSITLTSQPATNSLNAAYRPILVTATVSPAAPVVYCDIYFNSIFYKTISKTQGPYDFDVQNAAKEYLKKYLAPNGGSSFYNATPLITTCFVKIRSSAISLDGFIVPDVVVPIQGTGSIPPTSGDGTTSNTFFVLNSTLQHEDNQDLATHLNSFKSGTWNANCYPLTHRPANYKVAVGSSDYFPIVSNSTPACIKIHYKLRSSTSYTGISSCADCVDPGVSGTLPDAQVGVSYTTALTLTGDTGWGLSAVSKPAWMSITNVGGSVLITGTPTAEATGVVVSFTVSNACGSFDYSDTIDIAPADCVPVAISGSPALPDATIGTAYSYSFTLTGSQPFSLSSIVKPAWMTIAVSTNTVTFSGTPTTGSEGTGITVSFTITNACGSVPFSDTIDVAVPANITWNYTNGVGTGGRMRIIAGGSTLVDVTATESGSLVIATGVAVSVEVFSTLTGTANIDIAGPYSNSSSNTHIDTDGFTVAAGSYTIDGESL